MAKTVEVKTSDQAKAAVLKDTKGPTQTKAVGQKGLAPKKDSTGISAGTSKRGACLLQMR